MRRQLVFTAYNRPYYLEPIIESWNCARGIDRWNVEFFIEPSWMEGQIQDIASGLNAKNLVVRINPTKLGVLVNPWHAIDTAFESGMDFVVLAEDDVAVSQDVLEYFEWASEEYKNDSDVLCINAFSQLGGQENAITKSQKFSPLVWGIWKDRWNSSIRNTWDKDYSSGNPDGSEAGWDWNINRILQRNWKFVIKPLQSRSDHLGEYGGTHMTPDLYEFSRGSGFTPIRGQQKYYEVF